MSSAGREAAGATEARSGRVFPPLNAASGPALQGKWRETFSFPHLDFFRSVPYIEYFACVFPGGVIHRRGEILRKQGEVRCLILKLS